MSDHGCIQKSLNLYYCNYDKCTGCGYKVNLDTMYATFCLCNQCTPMYTHVHPCTHMYSHVHQCTLMYTQVHSCTPMYTHVLSCTPMYTHVHLHTFMYTHDTQVHQRTTMYTHVHSRTPIYTNIHPGTPMYILCIHYCTVYSILYTNLNYCTPRTLLYSTAVLEPLSYIKPYLTMREQMGRTMDSQFVSDDFATFVKINCNKLTVHYLKTRCS